MSKIKGLVWPINIWMAIYAVLFAAMCICDRHIVNEVTDRTTILTTYINPFEAIDVVLFVLISAIVYILLQLIMGGIDKLSNIVLNKNGKDECGFSWLSFLVIALVIMIAWVPYMMSYWPGGIYNDTLSSIHMALGKEPLDNQNTVLYALWWRLIFWIGSVVNQGEYGGLKLMTIVQPLIMALTAAGFFTWLQKKNVKRWIIVVGVTLYALMPIFPYYAVSMWKDTPFSVNMFIYTWFIYVFVSDNAGDSEHDWLTVKGYIQYIMLSLLIVFGRNNGIFVIIVTTLCLIVHVCRTCKKKDIIRFTAISLCIIVLSLIVQRPVYSALGIKKSESVEKYGIPLQQVAYMVTAGADMSEEEISVMDSILPMDGWINLYNPVVVDTIKFDPLFNRGYFNTHIGDFIKAYSGMVIKNPAAAVKGYLLATLGFWDAWESNSSAYICTTHCWNAEYFMSDYFNLHTGLYLADIVGPRWYISAGFLAWLMLMAIVLMSKYKEKRVYMVVIVPTLTLWLTLMVATPLAFSFRYVFSLLLCVPIYIMTIIKSHE